MIILAASNHQSVPSLIISTFILMYLTIQFGILFGEALIMLIRNLK